MKSIQKKTKKKNSWHEEGGGGAWAENSDEGAVVMQSRGGPWKCVPGRWWRALYRELGMALHPRHSNYDVSGTTAWGVCVVINLRQQRNESNEESGTLNLFNQSISPPTRSLPPLSLSSGAFKYISDLVG